MLAGSIASGSLSQYLALPYNVTNPYPPEQSHSRGPKCFATVGRQLFDFSPKLGTHGLQPGLARSYSFRSRTSVASAARYQD